MNAKKIILTALMTVSGTVFAVNNYWGGTPSDSVKDVTKWWYNGTIHQFPTGDDTIVVNRGDQGLVLKAGDSLAAAGFSIYGRKDQVTHVRLEGGTLTLAAEVNIGQNTGSGDLNYHMGDARLEIVGGVFTLASGKYFYIGRNCEATVRVCESGVLDLSGALLYLSKDWTAANRGRGSLVVENGGTLKLAMMYPDDDSVIVFRQANLVFTAAGDVFHSAYVGKKWNVCVGNGGLSVDTGANNVNFNRPLIAEEGATSGGFVKKGTGTFTFSKGNTWKPGPVTIEAGKVVAPGVDALPGYALGVTLEAGATLELGDGWSPAMVAEIKAMPTVLGTVLYTIENANDLTADNYGTSKTADSVEVFTGNNNFGGKFTIAKGTLAADFGRGLNANDHLQIGASASTSVLPAFSPISGSVTQNIGTGAGEISLFTGSAAGFTAFAKETTVNLNGGKELVRGAEGFNVPWLILNDDRALYPLTLTNPLDLNGGPLCIYTGASRATLAGVFRNSQSTAAFAKRGAGELHVKQGLPIANYYLYGGLLSVGEGTTSSLAELLINGGDLAVGAGSTINQSAKATCQNGTAVLTNCTYTYTTGDFLIKGGLFHILGGTFNYDNASNWFQTEAAGEFRMDGCTAWFASQLTVGRTSAASGNSLVTICGGAQVDTTGPGAVVQNGKLVVDGTGTLLKTKALIQGAHQDWMKDSSINGCGDIIVRGGTVQTSDDLVIARARSTRGSLRVEGGTVKVASGKSFVISDFGDATLEVAGGLMDASVSYGMLFMPGWNSGSWSEVSGRGRRAFARLTGGELKTSRIASGSADYDVTFVFDGGKLTRCGDADVEFNRVQKLRMTHKGGEYNVGSKDVKMYGAFAALESDEAVELTPADYNAAAVFAKSGTGMLTMVGANTYACGTAVKEGLLTLDTGASLPSDQIVRLEGGTLDLGGATQAVLALTGTGTVRGGTVKPTDGVYPGGVGTVGTLAFQDASVEGKVFVDFAEDGKSCDGLTFSGAVDLSKMLISFANPEKVDKTRSYVLLSASTVTGKPAVENCPRGYMVEVADDGVKLVRRGLAVILR